MTADPHLSIQFSTDARRSRATIPVVGDTTIGATDVKLGGLHMDAAGKIESSILADAAKFNQADQIKKLTASLSAEKRAKVATDFEAVFSSMLVKQMRETLTEGMFGGDSGDVYGGLFDLYLGRHLAESQPMGIDKMVNKYLDQTAGQSTFGM